MERTIPNEAWQHLTNAVFRDGHLYPDTLRVVNGVATYPDSDDEELNHWLSHFTMDNYAEWAGAAVVCPRAPALEETLFRFDGLGRFIDYDLPEPVPGRRFPGLVLLLDREPHDGLPEEMGPVRRYPSGERPAPGPRWLRDRHRSSDGEPVADLDTSNQPLHIPDN